MSTTKTHIVRDQEAYIQALRNKERMKRTRARSLGREKKVGVAELLRAGQEPNPGPSNGVEEKEGPRAQAPPDSPSQQRRSKLSVKRPERKEVKGAVPTVIRASAHAAMDELAMAARDGLQKLAGKMDADEEKRVEKLRADLERRANELNAVSARTSEAIAAQAQRFVGTSYHTVETGMVGASLATVATSPDTLLQPFFPHRWCEVTQVSVVPASQATVVDDKLKPEYNVIQQPLTEELARAPGRYNLLRVHVVKRDVGFFHTVRNQTHYDFEWSWEQWTSASSFRLARTPEFATNLHDVARWRANHKGYPVSDNLPEANSAYEDMAFTALLMVRHIGAGQLFEIAKDAFTKETNRRITNLFLSSNRNYPLATGTYLEGYRTPMSQLFPDAWAKCLETLQISGSVRDAANAFAEEAAKVPGSIKAKARGMKEAALNYCRVLPMQVQGEEGEPIRTAFPDPSDLGNQITAAFKRLFGSYRATEEPDTEIREAAVADVFVEAGERVDHPMDHEGLMAAVEAHIREHSEWAVDAA